MRYFLISVAVLLTASLNFNVCAEELTAALCKQKVQQAVKLIEAEGEPAFAKIKDPAGEFRFGNGEGYLWIQTPDAVMIMHPIKPEMDGTELSDYQDVKGLHIFVAFSEICEENGAGWVPYFWTKPGETKESPKVSYVSKAKFAGKEYIVGCGIYDVTAQDIKNQFPDDAVYEE